MRDILMAMDRELVLTLRDRLNIFVIAKKDPDVVIIPGSCSTITYTNDGNLGDAMCGRGCANCRVGYSCFDHTDCLSGLCSSGVSGNDTFVPIMDEDDYYKRPGFRGTCLESVFTEEDTSAASSTAYAFALMLLAATLTMLL
jgi:hypothetical protein